ncbi:MAG TPA: ATP-binding protein [Candidatus Didemnitutus sp.]|nr:ATP-binding protein [Candidatus Didemnitutus sp.]
MIAFSNHTENISISASTDSLRTIREFISSQIHDCGFTEFEENGVVLAVDEACANLIAHAFSHDASQSIEILVAVDDRDVRIEISDTARPFDPGTIEHPNMDDYFRERRVGGLGISLMRRVMDEVEYRPATQDQPRNTLVLTKRLAG